MRPQLHACCCCHAPSLPADANASSGPLVMASRPCILAGIQSALGEHRSAVSDITTGVMQVPARDQLDGHLLEVYLS